MAICSLKCQVLTIAIYHIVVGSLVLLGSVLALRDSYFYGNLVGGALTLVAGILLLVGVLRASRGLITGWLVIAIVLAVLAAVELGIHIYDLVTFDIQAGRGGYYNSDPAVQKRWQAVTQIAILSIHIFFSVICIITVLQYRRRTFVFSR